MIPNFLKYKMYVFLFFCLKSQLVGVHVTIKFCCLLSSDILNLCCLLFQSMTALQSLKQLFKTFRSVPGFDRTLQHVEFISASEGKVHCKMPVKEEHLNLRGSLHGGFTATLVDSITTCALATCEKPAFGVSVDMNITYIASAKAGDTLSITAEVLKRGNTLGYTKMVVENQKGNIVAVGRHTKFLK